MTPDDSGKPVAFVSTPLAGVPSAGDTRVGFVANTNAPVPVSSLITLASSADVVAAKAFNLFATYATVPPLPKATEEESVPENVSVLFAAKVLPLAIVSVDPVAGAVIVTLLILVAVATPRFGVTSVLFVRVSVPSSVANVPDAGSATVVVAPTVRVSAYAPLVAKLPPRVMVFPVLATPVPPYVGEMMVPCHCPAEMTPVEASEKFGAALLFPTLIDPPVYQLPLVLLRSDTVCAAVQLFEDVTSEEASRTYSVVDVPTR